MILHGDCLEHLKSLPDNSVESLVTDPPAGISFMGKEWDSDKGGRKEARPNNSVKGPRTWHTQIAVGIARVVLKS